MAKAKIDLGVSCKRSAPNCAAVLKRRERDGCRAEAQSWRVPSRMTTVLPPPLHHICTTSESRRVSSTASKGQAETASEQVLCGSVQVSDW